MEVLGYSVRLRMGEKPKDVYRELADGEADLCGEIWPANKRPERKAAASQVDVWMHEVLGSARLAPHPHRRGFLPRLDFR